MTATLTSVADVAEQATIFGPEDNLVGILTLPVTTTAGDVGVVFLNAGVLHRVGPHRLHVILARRLGARGVPSLRIDLSGIGDSRVPQGALSFRERAVTDARKAMDALGSAAGTRRFVLFGLCSGADNALATALADERVAGLVLLDPYTYVTPRARARKLVRRVEQLGSARRAIGWGFGVATRLVRARLGALGDQAGEDEQSGREVPPARVFGDQLDALVSRGVAILAVFSGSLEERYNHRDQLFEIFPRLRGRLERCYFPEANHMFTELGARKQLIATVCDWLERRM
jgi:pimeloyl-ACP methyl ester carboxylesterase